MLARLCLSRVGVGYASLQKSSVEVLGSDSGPLSYSPDDSRLPEESLPMDLPGTNCQCLVSPLSAGELSLGCLAPFPRPPPSPPPFSRAYGTASPPLLVFVCLPPSSVLPNPVPFPFPFSKARLFSFVVFPLPLNRCFILRLCRALVAACTD